MSLKVVLFGDLRNRLEGDEESVEIDDENVRFVRDVLHELGIHEDKVSHVFLDHSYSSVDREIGKENERLALFPKDMSLLYKWYFEEKQC